MKRALIFSLAYLPHVGGAELAVHELTKRLEEYEFTIVTLRFRASDSEIETHGRVRIYRVGSGSSYLQKVLYVPRAARLAARLHREHAFDLVWAMMSYMVFPVVLARLGGVRVPYVLTLQDGDPYEHVFRRPHIVPLMPLLWYGFQHAAQITVLSRYLELWPRRMGYDGVVHVIPNGVDVEAYAGAMPRDIGKKPGEFWLVSASRLVAKNGLDDCVRALVLVPSYVHLLILGSGVEERRLRTLVDDLELMARVHFAGSVPHSELPGYLHAVDVFVRPSRSEGFGSAFVEAMAAGLPVIATQVGGIADFLFDAVRDPAHPATGFAVDPDAPEQVAAAVKEIMTHPHKVQAVRQHAFALVRERYDWAFVAEQMRRVFGTIGA